MSDGFSQMESYVESAACGLRTVQGAGKYPKKVCSAAMLGANMLNAQKGAISKLRHDNDRMVEEIAELRGALKSLIGKGIDLLNAEDVSDDEDAASIHANFNDAIIKSEQLLAKLNQEGGE